jgi:hypothetical protein
MQIGKTVSAVLDESSSQIAKEGVPGIDVALLGVGNHVQYKPDPKTHRIRVLGSTLT